VHNNCENPLDMIRVGRIQASLDCEWNSARRLLQGSCLLLVAEILQRFYRVQFQWWIGNPESTKFSEVNIVFFLKKAMMGVKNSYFCKDFKNVNVTKSNEACFCCCIFF
jgi:hypothetical protein